MQSEPQANSPVPPADLSLDSEVRAHDAAVAASGLTVWVGAEPTFTRRDSEAAEWLSEPLGGEKHDYALRIVGELRERRPGSLVLRTVGRQYPAEPLPRWSVGLLERRDGRAAWTGPPDPLSAFPAHPGPERLDAFWHGLQQRLIDRGWDCRRFGVSSALDRRLVFRIDGAPATHRDEDPRLTRPPIQTQKTPPEGLSDPLAALGLMLIAIGVIQTDGGASACVELPAFSAVDEFLACLADIGAAATAAGLPALVLQGFPPPVDARLAWTSVTPDPAVVEINQAPQPDVTGFLASTREQFEVAQALGLSPYRLQYNGSVSDSGGGGQFTLGGRSPAESPFLSIPHLLPRLVRYFNHHPALSYLFAPDYVGGASQSPRSDEGTRDAFRELEVALQQLASAPQPSAEFLWASLAPFLADPSGNRHRSELNIEKLWNPYLPTRGCLGLIEFRAFRMPCSAGRAAAIAALLRAIVAMLAKADPAPHLHDWGDALHDRFALPFFLRQDLHGVLDDLARHRLPLGHGLQSALLDDPFRSRWQAVHAGCELTLESAIEFWPLVGDVASQESGGSRQVDSSTLRLQVGLRRVAADAPALDAWRLQVAGYELPLRRVDDRSGEIALIGLRYRDFTPWRGLHPAIKPQGPLVLILTHPALDEALQASLHGWRPDGLAYDGLPPDLDIAAARRSERLVTRRLSRAAVPHPKRLPADAVTLYTVDLRRLPQAAD